MHKIMEYSLRELLSIPNNHFISHLIQHYSQQIKLSNSKISLYLHHYYFEFEYSDDKSDLYLFSAQCYIMVYVDSMKHLIRHIFIHVFLILVILSLTLPLISLQLMLISSFV